MMLQHGCLLSLSYPFSVDIMISKTNLKNIYIILIQLQIKKHFMKQSISLSQTSPSINIVNQLHFPQLMILTVLYTRNNGTGTRLSSIPDSHEHDEKAPVIALLTWIQNLFFFSRSELTQNPWLQYSSDLEPHRQR